MGFKVGDKVEILPLAIKVGVESEEIGKIGVISSINSQISTWSGFMVQMNEVCKIRGYIPKWSVGEGMIKLLPRKNQQLLFDFME